MPRIIAGKYKGFQLKAPKGENTRPTTDKVKESMFSIIQAHVPSSKVLDVFAGSGQIGLEALSRGAQQAYFIERDARAVSALKTNINFVGVNDHAIVMIGDALKLFRVLGKKETQFDIVFFDPPYQRAKHLFEQSAELLMKYDLLSPDAIIIVEHASEDVFDENVMNLTLSRRCKYGTTMLTFYNRENNLEDKAKL